VVWSSTLCPRFRFGHVTAMLGLAIPAITGAVVHFTRGVDPDLTGAATGAWSGALAGGGCRRSRCSAGAGCCRRLTPRLDAAMTPTGTRPLRAGKCRAVLTGGGDHGSALRVDCADGQEEPRDQGEGQQRFVHKSGSS